MAIPGEELSGRPLHIFWIVDCSGSMSVDGKIQSLNNAISSVIPDIQNIAKQNPEVNIFVRVVKFSSGASWHIAEAVPIEEFKWKEITTGGLTDLGEALTLVAEKLKTISMAENSLPPILVLITDGFPTDEYTTGLYNLMKSDIGHKAVKIAVAVGHDANMEVLRAFINNGNIEPLLANNAKDLAKYLRVIVDLIDKEISPPEAQTQNTLEINIDKPSEESVFDEEIW